MSGLTLWEGAGSNRATNAPYRVYGGTALLGTLAVDQKLAPYGPTAGGVMTFQSLGVFNVTSGILRVVLSNHGDGYVVVDAVHVAFDGPESVGGGAVLPAGERSALRSAELGPILARVIVLACRACV